MILQRWLRAVHGSRAPAGPHASLTVALVADELTRTCLSRECRILDLAPGSFHRTMRRDRPDLVFVESAWQGWRNSWKFRIAAYPDHPERNNSDLVRLVGHARDLGIPIVFWNKEDSVHFDRFIASAKLFDAIFTVDASCIDRYRSVVGDGVHVGALPFAVQPAIHSFSGIDEATRRGASFVGSYSRHIHDARRDRQDMLLEAAAGTLGLTVYDRNSDRRGGHYRYPAFAGLKVHPKVSYARTAAIYKSHLASLNVNTIENSPTMFSRRLIEILACGGLAVSTPALAIDRMFKDFCHVVGDAPAAHALFARLARDGYSARDREMMRAGAEHVLAHHTWAHRLETILDAVGRKTR
ncbi:MAG: glycosyltransferase [Burkholderiaceae bacterium]|nr:glycosyltransferase [Burkholderiaceae bacterium]